MKAQHIEIPAGTVIIDGKRYVMTKNQSFYPSSNSEGVLATPKKDDTE